jgi:uncharacterized membrane protein
MAAKMLASLTIGAREWVWPAIFIFAAGSALAIWGYTRVNASLGTRLLGLILRVAGLAALAACLLDPLWKDTQPRPGANVFAIIADNSQGMEIQDRGATKTRGAQLRDLVAQDKAPWQIKLAETFQLRRYLFDSRLSSTRDFSELKFDGRASAIHSALADVAERYRGQPLAGVLLFTDGNATDTAPPQQPGLPPIYPVMMGREGGLRDLSIVSVNASQSAFEDAPVTIQAEAFASGFAGESVLVEIIDVTGAGSGKTNSVVTQSAQTVKADDEKLYFRFQIKPEKRGLVFYRVHLAPERKESAPEATFANNDRVVTVDRGGGPYRILYISGRPNWEYKFIKRALQEDEQVELAAIIRIARREPKFTFRGRVGESSNPLFRGFGQTDEETERYDQPVLVRQLPDSMEENDLKGGFPKVPEDLYRFHALIIDDLESDFFTADQRSLIQRFVTDRGGGLLMLGGPDSLTQGKYDRTPIGDMLPFYLSGAPGGKPPEGLKLNLTREGWLQPWARLRATEPEEKARIEQTPPYMSMNRVGGLKPGASLIATATDPAGKQYPALAVQRFGHGRTAALAIADMWHGALGDEDRQKDLAKTWRQLARWLTTDVPEQVKLEAVSTNANGAEAITLRVRAKDKAFQPVDNAVVTVGVEAVGGTETNRVQLTAEAVPNEAGVFETTFMPRQTGGYRADATVVDSAGQLLGHSTAGWASEPLADEFRSLQPNRALLESIARQSGGEVIAPEKLGSFAGSLKTRRAPIQEMVSTPIWDKPLVFLFALACFLGEWGLRRMRGLA